MLGIVLSWFLIAAVTGWMANETGRNPWGWGIMAFLCGIIVTMILGVVILVRGKLVESN